MENEKITVRFGGNETERRKKRGKPCEPSTWCLFKAVQGFLQEANMIRKGGIGETLRLFTVNGLG
jgi:hypothetical protein